MIRRVLGRQLNKNLLPYPMQVGIDRGVAWRSLKVRGLLIAASAQVVVIWWEKLVRSSCSLFLLEWPS